MANKECAKCIHNAVCKTAESCDGYVSGCKHFKEGWISVKDRLPARHQNVLTVRADRKIRFDAIGSLDVWYEELWHTGNPVTHWMPLPQPPKGE